MVENSAEIDVLKWEKELLACEAEILQLSGL